MWFDINPLSDIDQSRLIFLFWACFCLRFSCSLSALSISLTNWNLDKKSFHMTNQPTPMQNTTSERDVSNVMIASAISFVCSESIFIRSWKGMIIAFFVYELWFWKSLLIPFYTEKIVSIGSILTRMLEWCNLFLKWYWLFTYILSVLFNRVLWIIQNFVLNILS